VREERNVKSEVSHLQFIILYWLLWWRQSFDVLGGATHSIILVRCPLSFCGEERPPLGGFGRVLSWSI